MLPKKDGFEINGGNVIALCFSLNTKIFNGTKVSLKNELDEEIISFEAKEDFRTLIISNSKLTSGTYYLYENGKKQIIQHKQNSLFFIAYEVTI